MTTRKKRTWLTGCLVAGLLLSLTEILLRRGQFHYETGVEFAYPRPADFLFLRYDPDVFWTHPPVFPNVNSWGFPGKEFVIPKPEGGYRILFLGDSIMQAGYPALVADHLQQAHPQVESVSLAINGYSSYQGRILAEKYGALLEPDLVVVQFGWNDHWLAYGKPDAEKVLSPAIQWQAPLYQLYNRLRLLQGLAWIGAQWKGTPAQTGELRVSPTQYRENLTAIRQMFEARGVPVVFVTAPSGFEKLGVSEVIITRGFATNAARAHQLHQQYNAIVREVAGGIVDLEKQFESLTEQKLDAYFQADHIHPTQEGTQEIAEWVYAGIVGFLK